MEETALRLRYWRIIRRNLRNASMMRLLHRQGRFRPEDGLESVKKTHQVAGVGRGGIEVGRCRPGRRYLPSSGKPEAGARPAAFFNSDPTTPDQDMSLTMAQGMK